MPDRPARQRIAIEQGPDEAGLRRRDDRSDLLVPVRKGDERPRDSGAIGPVLAVPAVVLGPADKIEQPAARDEVMHKMRAGSDPGLRAEREPEIGDARDRNQPAIRDAASKCRLFGAEQCRPDSRMYAVR